MRKTESNGLVYYQSEILLNLGFENFFFTRKGGVSLGELAELNLSFRAGDDPERVQSNLDKTRRVMKAGHLVMVHQVHGAKALLLEQGPIEPESLRNQERDAIVTRMPGIGIGVLCADCFPLLLAEPEQKIIGIAHCGRRGIISGVIENTLDEIVRLGGKVGRIIAAIGPGICGECYQVDQPVILEYREKFPQGEGRIWRRGPGFYLLDLKQAMVSVLADAGVAEDRIEDLGLCTLEGEDFFSHRRSLGQAGRQLSAIVIK